MTELKEEQEAAEDRRCDFCGSATAVLYCRADSASLCLGCDREVHATNPLFTKHTRSLLCDACDASPATIFCCNHAAVFCQNCDWESHTPCLSPPHVRRPLEGFSGCPSVAELLAVFGFQDVGKKALLQDDHYGGAGAGDDDDGISDYLVWDTPAVVSLDELIAPSDSKPNFQAMGVPPLPKNRNAACGQHKEEILAQLRKMSKLEPDICADQEEFEPVVGIQAMENELNDFFGEKNYGFKQNMESTLVPYSETTGFQWYNDVGEFADQGFGPTLLQGFNETTCLVPDKDSDVGDSSGAANNHNEGQSNHSSHTETFQVPPPIVAPRELNSRERETAISRYKEKKKTRRYEKQIRYESRKVRAETRIRIKGRFAKMDRRDSGTTR
nr:zinc finger protein CONSTANS-LIKE 13 [Ipomoea batatas]